MKTRTPDEIYEEICSIEMPEFPRGAPAAERLAHWEAAAEVCRRRHELWNELASALVEQPEPTVVWQLAAANGAGSHALEMQIQAEERIEVIKQRMGDQLNVT